jgi:LPS-assembly lipoprotein
MSSPDRPFFSPYKGRAIARLAAAAFMALSASACLRPLNGPTASGASMPEVLASIEVAPALTAVGQERLSHFLRSELVFDLNGSGEPHPKRYRLTVQAAERVATPLVDAVTGRAVAATVVAEADYTLKSLDGTRTITAGKATASASYDRYLQRFANVRAARDAEMRAAKLLSEQIRTRLAAVLLTAS